MLDVMLTEEQLDTVYARFASHDVNGDGVRYTEFVEYLYNTAHDISRTSSQDQQRSVRTFHRQRQHGGGGDNDDHHHYSVVDPRSAVPVLDVVVPPPDSVPKDILAALRRKLRSRSCTWMTETQLFLDVDTNRSGKVSPREFRSWARRVGLALTDEQCALVLGNDKHEVDLAEFTEALNRVREHPSSSSSRPMPWELPDVDDARKRRLALKEVANRVDETLTTALTLCTDDRRTDQELIGRLAEGVLSRRGSSLLREFRRLDTDGSGKIDAGELYGVMRKVGLEVSRERAKTLMSKCDRDGDGKMTMSDFVFLISNNSIPSSVLPDISNGAQVDNDDDGNEVDDSSGDIEKSDVAAIKQYRQALRSSGIATRSFFQQIDKSRCQFITSAQLKDSFDKFEVNTTQEQVNRIMNKYTSNGGSEVLKYFQFVKLMSSPLE